MKLFVYLFVFSAALLSSICSYHVLTHKTQREILLLTEKFNEAYKNQDYKFLNEILADDLSSISSEHKSVYNKSDFLEGLKTYETDKVKIDSIEVVPVWIQADRANPLITFETKTVITIDGKSSIYYGQYTFTLAKRNAEWQIVSINFDINYIHQEPHWLLRKFNRPT